VSSYFTVKSGTPLHLKWLDLWRRWLKQLPPGLTLKVSTVPTTHIYVVWMNVTINIHYFPTQHSSIGIYNRNTCSLWGTNWIFTYNAI